MSRAPLEAGHGDAGVHQDEVTRPTGLHQPAVDCSVRPPASTSTRPSGEHGADLGHPALVRAGHADVVGALGLRGEQPGMLEDDMGQLPQQVVEQHEVARTRGQGRILGVQPHHVVGAGARPPAGSRPAPSQSLVRPQASARATRSAVPPDRPRCSRTAGGPPAGRAGARSRPPRPRRR